MFKPPTRSIKARDRNVVVRCPVCGITTIRTARNQVYCSKHCKKKAERCQAPETKNKTLYGPLFDFGGAGCPKNQDKTTGYNTPSKGICGPSVAVQVEVINSREWTETVSTEGIRSFVTTIRPAALIPKVRS
jgi:hypothetical protein